MSLLKKRIISAVILLPGVIGIMIWGGWAYTLLIVTITLLAGIEVVRMFRRKSYALSPLWISAMALVWQAEAIWGGGDWHKMGIVGVVLCTTLWALIQARGAANRQREDSAIMWAQSPTEQWALTLAVGVYLGLGGAHLIRLRDHTEGLWWTLTTCLIVWIGDSAAYFAGSRWGRHKIAPSISPGKSWEGYAAQIISGVVSGAFLGWLWPVAVGAVTLTVGKGIIVGCVISILCPAGDFFVSMIKREVGVKDTSQLIPGHGGVLDRMDSIIWACILAYSLINTVM